VTEDRGSCTSATQLASGAARRHKLPLMAQNVRNHLASCGYLQGFTGSHGKLAVVNVRARRVYERRPEDVAFRKHFWGREQELRDEVEQKLASAEAHAPRILSELTARGAPAHGSRDRGLLLQFLAMHFVRNPAWRNLVSEVLKRRIVAQGHDGPEWRHLRELLLSDRYWVDTILRQIPQIAALLGSMHWALLRFPAPWLASCDQPLVPLALVPHGVRVRFDETPGLLDTIEYRFVVDPCHAIILSWHDAPDWQTWSSADLHIAADINRSVVGHCDVEYFHKPDFKPPFVAPPWMPTRECNPISPKLHEGYWREAALRSRRRAEAAVIVQDAINRQVTDEIRTVIVTERAAA
jgi:hypothetical protein